MTESPRELYRAVQNNDAVLKNHFTGNLWFHSHAWFRKQEGGDRLEGIGSFKGPDGINRDVFDEHPGRPAYFMSFSKDRAGALTHGRENHRVLKLSDPIGFQGEIKALLPTCGFVEVEWIKIEYGKTFEVLDDPGSRTLHRKYRCKPDEFADEREWRLQIQFMHSFRIQNDTLKFRWGRIGNFFTAIGTR